LDGRDGDEGRIGQAGGQIGLYRFAVVGELAQQVWELAHVEGVDEEPGHAAGGRAFEEPMAPMVMSPSPSISASMFFMQWAPPMGQKRLDPAVELCGQSLQHVAQPGPGLCAPTAD